MHELKTGLNADKFATFLDASRNFLSLIRWIAPSASMPSTSRNKKFALRAASSLESTTREQRALLIFSVFSNPYGNPFP